jgi:hypothetical protein
MKKGHAPPILVVNPAGYTRPLAKVENLPVDDVGNDHAKIF